MTNKTYTWAVESVDTFNKTFVVLYSSVPMNTSIRLNLPLPATLDQIASTVELYVPSNLHDVLVEPVKLPIDVAALMALTGTAVTIAADPYPSLQQQANTFNRRIAQSLVDLGVTQTNVYVAPEPADVTDTGAAPTVIS